MFQIKQSPEDFIVEEIPKDLPLGKGDYTYFILEKKNWNTREAIKAIAARLKVKERFFNVAGIKDKRAITKQYISVYKVKPDRLERLKIKDIHITVLGKGNERLRLGQLYGNKFKIRVRNADCEPQEVSFIENYYDNQRFGGKNKILGRAIVKKEFRKACFSLGIRWESGDYIGALRQLGKNILRFYVNSYQSYLFNEALERYLKEKYKTSFLVDYSEGTFTFSEEKLKNQKFPILGFLTEFNDKDVERIYYQIMKEEKLDKRDFIIKQIPELSSEGSERDMFSEVKELEIKKESNKTYFITFILPPGSYATIVIKKMFSKHL